MKYLTVLTLSVVLLSVLSGCSSGAKASPPAATPSLARPSPTTGSAPVEDQASLLAALQAAGATATAGDTVTQDFFTPQGQIIKLNGADIQVFEYESAEAMEAEASQVAPDGGSVGTSMMMWMDKPHFYKTGRIIVLYVGSDAAIKGLLDQVIGPQFAGQ